MNTSTSKKTAVKDSLSERRKQEAQALRENLKRRKEQQRAKKEQKT
ncbi:hypothetical protein [Commensalibacter oyaizuii]|uniref:Uncharacterized protein n=1 Tax=Commensalibacter oyaizuii TaxID=3043873 RepID=A0ABT6Q4J4_9PROT|nr:hypothetical protein [Commensalibacter sp. TBRC 16381]MDI2091481.1 hypothetical protein [Commensalibacter sp. TBRC 16381]